MGQKYALAIHGGAGTLIKGDMTPEKEAAYRAALEDALDNGYRLLSSGGSAIDAVEAAVIILENCPLFNAGKGSVFTAEGKHEMDASIMNGSNLKAGAVGLISGIKNPVSLARDVMEHSGHVFLAGEGALQFARMRGYQLEDPAYFHEDFRYRQWLEIRDSEDFQLDHASKRNSKFGTVGAVACDMNGHLAAATSTGGMTNKKFGRLGDSPMIGAGNYANNKTCAVSCTGSGEYFIRGVVAYDVSCLMEFKGLSLAEACRMVIHERLAAIGGDGGLVAVDASGNVALPFNTEGMYRAYQVMEKDAQINIYKD